MNNIHNMKKRTSKSRGPFVVLLAVLLILLIISCVKYIEEYKRLAVDVSITDNSDPFGQNDTYDDTPGSILTEEPTPIETNSPSASPYTEVDSPTIPVETEVPTEAPTIEPSHSPPPPIEIDGMVLLTDLDDSFIIDLKYATEDNFVGKPVYNVEAAVINVDTGLRLINANNEFKKKGYRIKIWDAYRPLSVQQVFWEACPDPRWIAKPEVVTETTKFRPSHNNGMSVDITLVDEDGNELEMPTGFDEFSEKARADYNKMSKKAKENVDYLIKVMEKHGFKNYYREWWHFNDVEGKPIPYSDTPLEEFLK